MTRWCEQRTTQHHDNVRFLVRISRYCTESTATRPGSRQDYGPLSTIHGIGHDSLSCIQEPGYRVESILGFSESNVILSLLRSDKTTTLVLCTFIYTTHGPSRFHISFWRCTKCVDLNYPFGVLTWQWLFHRNKLKDSQNLSRINHSWNK